jgi:hypothetical protein
LRYGNGRQGRDGACWGTRARALGDKVERKQGGKEGREARERAHERGEEKRREEKEREREVIDVDECVTEW